MSENLGDNIEKTSTYCQSGGLCSLDLEPAATKKESGFKRVFHKLHDLILGDSAGPKVQTALADGDASKVSAKDAKAVAKSLAFLDKNVHIVAHDMAPGYRLTFNRSYASNINSDYIAGANLTGSAGLSAPKYHGELVKEMNKRLPAIEETMRQELLALKLKADLTSTPNDNIDKLGQSLDKLQTHQKKLNEMVYGISEKPREQLVAAVTEQITKRPSLREFAQELVQLSDDLKEAQKIQKQIRRNLQG